MGDYVKSMIFGGLDGILTSFAIVAGAAGGRLPVQVVLVLGFSNIFADAFSMGMGEYLSSKAHNEFVLKEKERETWCVGGLGMFCGVRGCLWGAGLIAWWVGWVDGR